jgi:hypothetical protein
MVGSIEREKLNNKWCYTATRSSARKKIKRALRKRHTTFAKLELTKYFE